MEAKKVQQYVTKRIVELYSTKTLASLDVTSQNLPKIAKEMEITTAELIAKIQNAKSECASAKHSGRKYPLSANEPRE